MPATWLIVLAWVSLAVAFGCAAVILVDIYGLGYRQRMWIMEPVWVVTALYLSLVAIWGYRRFGRPSGAKWLAERGRDAPPPKPRWAAVGVGATHCGAGCTLGDIISEFVIFGIGATIAGVSLYASMLGDYIAALALGIMFQFFAIAPMRGLDVREGLIAASKADVLSLTAFEVGLFGWMALMYYVLFPAPHHLEANSPVFWFLMQIGMAVGFLTTYPMNVWLIRRGVKEIM